MELSDFRLTGFLHNLALDAVCFAPSFPNTSAQDGFNIINSYLQRRLDEYSSGQTLNLSYDQIVNYYAEFVTNNPEGLYKLRAEGWISDAQLELITSISNHVLNNLIGQVADVSQEVVKIDLSLFYDYITKSKFSDQEKAVLYGTCSVLEHSSLYWTSARANNTNKWNSTMGRKAAPDDWNADIIGGIIGFVLGGGFTPFGIFLGGSAAASFSYFWHSINEPAP